MEQINKGQDLFEQGNKAFLQEENALAAALYQQVIQEGYQTYSIYHNLANALELTEDISEAEDYHKKAMKRAETKEEKKDALFSLGTFYYRNELMLKAEKIAKQAMDQHPEEYFGYQLMFFIGM